MISATKIFTVLSFTSPPSNGLSQSALQNSTAKSSSIGSLRKRVCIFICLISLLLIATGCEATSSVSITLQDNASGTLLVRLDLDAEAASLLRRDAYNSTTIDSLFDTAKLDKAGFDVVTGEEDDGRVFVSISAGFTNEKELQDALVVIAGEEVINATLKTSKSLTREKSTATLKVDLATLRNMYLEDKEIRAKVVASGIDEQEYEDVVISAFNATTLNLVLASASEKKTAQIKGVQPHAKELSLSSEHIRLKYIVNIVGAVICVIIALVMLIRLCRNPRLLSKGPGGLIPQKGQNDDDRFGGSDPQEGE